LLGNAVVNSAIDFCIVSPFGL